MRFFAQAWSRVGRKAGQIALVTANFGGIDDVKPLPAMEGIDGFYYTDRLPAAPGETAVWGGWTPVLRGADLPASWSPRLRGKYFKCQIHRLAETLGYRWLAWADASFRLHDLAFLKTAVEHLKRLPARRRLLLVPHPERHSVREEYEFVRTGLTAGDPYLVTRYRQDNLAAQVEQLLSERCNIDNGLWYAGIWLIENNRHTNRCWDTWWSHVQRFRVLDQLSLPPILERAALVPLPLTLPLSGNAYFQWQAHRQLI